MSSEPLSPEAFANALQKGLGRAWLHLRDHGDAGVKTKLRHAVGESLAYDWQSEGDRASWLIGLLDQLPNPRPYFELVLAAFPRATEPADLAQLSGMLRILAERGDVAAATLLRSAIEKLALEQLDIVGPHLIDLDGLAAFVAIAERIGGGGWPGGGWLQAFATDVLGEDVVTAALVSSEIPSVRAYATAVAAAPEMEEPRLRLTLPEFLLQLESEPASRHRRLALRFSRHAEPGELVELVGCIESGGPHVVGLLHAARRHALPRLPANLLTLASSSDPAVAESAVHALRHFRSPEVLALGRKLVAQDRWVALPLLAAAEAVELGSLATRLPRKGQPEALHRLGMDILALCENGDPVSAPLLIWVAEATPCSFCRSGAIRRLVEMSMLPPSLAEEALHDCCRETRELVAAVKAP